MTEPIPRNYSNSKLSISSRRSTISTISGTKNECPICQNSFTDPIKLSCRSSHEFCFSCILKWLEKKEKLDSCPLCRGGDKFIIITSGKPSQNYKHGSFNHFMLSKDILQKATLLRVAPENSCLISEKLLLTYVKNKDQLELAIESRMDSDKLFKLIRWDIPSIYEYCDLCYYSSLRLRPRLTTRTIVSGNIEEISNVIPSPPPGSPPPI